MSTPTPAVNLQVLMAELPNVLASLPDFAKLMSDLATNGVSDVTIVDLEKALTDLLPAEAVTITEVGTVLAALIDAFKAFTAKKA